MVIPNIVNETILNNFDGVKIKRIRKNMKIKNSILCRSS